MTIHTLTSLIEPLIQCCIIFAVWKALQTKNRSVWDHQVVTVERFYGWRERFERRMLKKYRDMMNEMEGKRNSATIRASVAEKMADRAFNMASSATIGVVALQKALTVPRLLTKQQGQINQLAKDEIDELFKVKGAQEWLKPLMSDEELDILEKAEAEAERQRMNSEESEAN